MDLWTDEGVRQLRYSLRYAWDARVAAYDNVRIDRLAYRRVRADENALAFLRFKDSIDSHSVKDLANGHLVDIDVPDFSDRAAAAARESLDHDGREIARRRGELPSVDTIKAGHAELARTISAFDAAENDLLDAVIDTQREAIGLSLGPRPVAGEKDALWVDGARAMVAERALGHGWHQLNDGRSHVNARRIARAQRVSDIAVEVLPMPDFVELNAVHREAGLKSARAAGQLFRARGDERIPLQAEADRAHAETAAGLQKLEMARASAPRICVLREPDFVVSRTGRPAETPEDMATWAPAAAAWAEAVVDLSPEQIEECLTTRGYALESTAFRQLGEAMSEWSFWKVEPGELPEHRTPFEIVTSPLSSNSLYIPRAGNSPELS